VKANTLRLYLPSDSESWIEVKEQLTIGEQKRLSTAGLRRIRTGGENVKQEGSDIDVDWVAYSFARMRTWVVDWGGPVFMDVDGKGVGFSDDALEAMHPDVYEEIENLLTAHIEQREAEKKVKPGSIEVSATLASPDG
jgi:hypothetical protein